MIRPFFKIFSNNLIKIGAKKEVIASLLSQLSNLNTLQNIEKNLNSRLMDHSQDPNSENADISDLLEKFTSTRNVFFERKRIRAFELFILGAQNYLSTFNEGTVKSDLVEHLQKQIQIVLD